MCFFRYINRITEPVYSELPYFALSFLLLTPLTIADVKGQILSFIWNEEWFDIFRYLCVVLTFSYITSLILYIIKGWKHIIVKLLFYSFSLGLFIIFKFLALNFDTMLNPQYLLVAGETNPKESLEFLSTFLFSTNGIILLSYIIIICASIILLEKHKSLFHKKIVKWLLSIVTLFMMIGMIPTGKMLYDLQKAQTVYDVENWHSFYNGFPMDLLTNLFYCVKSITVASDEVEIATKGVERLQNEPIPKAYNDSLNLVLVIGESYIKHHSSLYGYTLHTNPLLEKEVDRNNLFVFTDVVSPYNLTSYVLRNIFFTNSISEGEKWYNKAFFPLLFKKAGYNVYFWDNQKDDDPATAYAFSLNALFYNHTVAENSYTDVNKQAYPYDGELISDYYQKGITTSNNLIMFHLMGQHLDAAQRYPHENKYAPFNKDSVKRQDGWLNDDKREAIAHYDNATYYNDFVISQIIEREKNNNTILIYLSDHGEEIYDYRDSEGRKGGLPDAAGMKNYLKYQNEIPFMIWCSPIYQSKNPEIIEKIKAAINKPFVIDNIPHLLLDIGSIKTKYFNPQRDLISPSYICKKRIVYDNLNYDELAK